MLFCSVEPLDGVTKGALFPASLHSQKYRAKRCCHDEHKAVISAAGADIQRQRGRKDWRWRRRFQRDFCQHQLLQRSYVSTAGHGSWVMGNGSWVMKIDFDLRYTYYSTDTLRDAISILIPQPCRPLVGEARPGNIVMSSSVRPYVCVHVTTLRLIR